jgi:hypothetical protein
MSFILKIFRTLFYYIKFSIIHLKLYYLEYNLFQEPEIKFNFNPYSNITEYGLRKKMLIIK